MGSHVFFKKFLLSSPPTGPDTVALVLYHITTPGTW